MKLRGSEKDTGGLEGRLWDGNDVNILHMCDSQKIVKKNARG